MIPYVCVVCHCMRICIRSHSTIKTVEEPKATHTLNLLLESCCVYMISEKMQKENFMLFHCMLEGSTSLSLLLDVSAEKLF